MNTAPQAIPRRIRYRNRILGLIPWLERLAELRQLLRASRRWRTEGLFVPVPFFIRRAQLLNHARDIGADIAVETGTFRGDTTAFLAGHLSEVHTIEVVPDLANLARERFRKNPSVSVWNGNSPEVLRHILPKLRGSILFYLDGHYSGGITGKGDKSCPVREELEAICELCSEEVRIIIDDARLFGIDPEYPSITDICVWLAHFRPAARVRVEYDTIVIEDIL